MLRLIASNVSDYVCTKLVLELYRKFRLGLFNDQMKRESFFKTIPKDELDDDDDGSTDQTGTDFPPIPNPRHGKVFIEDELFVNSSSETSFIEQIQPRRAVSFSLPTTIDDRQIHLRDSPVSFYKDIHQAMNVQNQSSDRLNPPRKSVEFHFEEKITPSPYATTYLTTRNQDEQDGSFIDDNTSTSSISGQVTRPTTTNLSVQRTHDV